MGLSFDKVNCTLFAQILIAQIFAKLKNNKKIFKKTESYSIPSFAIIFFKFSNRGSFLSRKSNALIWVLRSIHYSEIR